MSNQFDTILSVMAAGQGRSALPLPCLFPCLTAKISAKDILCKIISPASGTLDFTIISRRLRVLELLQISVFH